MDIKTLKTNVWSAMAKIRVKTTCHLLQKEIPFIDMSICEGNKKKTLSVKNVQYWTR